MSLEYPLGSENNPKDSFEYKHGDPYMTEVLSDFTQENINKWTGPENLGQIIPREFEGFKIYSSVDGGAVPGREVSLVLLSNEGRYPQHIHKHSDALFLVVDGSIIFLSGKIKFTINKGDMIKIPRGTAHGFQFPDSEQESVFKFISIQYPPIRTINPETGEYQEDFHDLSDLV